MTDAQKIIIHRRAVEDLSNREFLPVHFDLPLTLVVSMIGQLQLAFRHPRNVVKGKKEVEDFVKEIILQIDPKKGDVYQFLMMGFDSSQDI